MRLNPSMNTRYYPIFTFVIFHYYLIRTDCYTRNKRGSPSELTPDLVRANGKQQISEQPDEREKLTKDCEKLFRYLYAFNNAFNENSDKRKGGLTSTFEMEFVEDPVTHEEGTLGSMLKDDYEKNHIIVNGELKAIDKVMTKSVRMFQLWKVGFGEKTYIEQDHAKSIVKSALHSYWASVVGQFLQCVYNLYMPKLEHSMHMDAKNKAHDTEQEQEETAKVERNAAHVTYLEIYNLAHQGDLPTRLKKQWEIFERKMAAIKFLRSEADTFFSKLTNPQSHSQKWKIAHNHQPLKDNTSIVEGNILSCASSINLSEVLEKLYEEFGSSADNKCEFDTGGEETVKMKPNNALRNDLRHSLLPQKHAP